MGYAQAILMVLFVVGFVLFAYGVTYSSPGASATLDVVATQSADVPSSADVVTYGNLSSSARDAFQRAVETGSMASIASAKAQIHAEYVEYEGTYYRVDVVPGSRTNPPFEVSLGALGLVISSLSTVVYLLLRRESIV